MSEYRSNTKDHEIIDSIAKLPKAMRLHSTEAEFQQALKDQATILNDTPFASDAAEAAYQQAVKDGVRITRDQVRRMLQAFDIEHGEHAVNNIYPNTHG